MAKHATLPQRKTKVTLLEIYRFSPKKYAVWFAIWTVIALLFAHSEITDSYDEGFTGAMWEPWVWVFTAFYSIALASPAIIYLCYRWPIKGPLQWRATLKISLAYLLFAPAHTTMMYGSRVLVYQLVGQSYPYGANYLYEFFKPMTAYFLVVFVTYAYIAFARVQQEQAQSSRLAVELAQARLENLQNQLQPHFLFNTLNLISSTMYQSVEKADDIITELADLLRYSLTTSQQPFISLKEELAIAESFLNIVKLRFGERVSITIEVDESAQNVMVPSMILQSLLENAVKHGIEPTSGPGSIVVEVKKTANQLQLRIRNSAPVSSFKASSNQSSFGIGLKNTRQRLEHLYPEQFQCELDVNNQGLTTVLLVMPADQLLGENRGENA